MKRISRWLLLPLLAVALTSACKSNSPFLKPPHWTVEANPLDYVQFLCGANQESTSGAEALKLELLGTGYLTAWSGRSTRVTSEFWHEPTNDDRWDEYSSDSVHVSENYVRACYQHLVDTGFFENESMFHRQTAGPKQGIFVVASINGRKKAGFTNDPDVEAAVRELMKQF